MEEKDPNNQLITDLPGLIDIIIKTTVATEHTYAILIQIILNRINLDFFNLIIIAPLCIARMLIYR
jgi:hypothetical protein